MRYFLVRILSPLLFLTLILLPLSGVGAQLELSPAATAQDLVDKINELRDSKGLAPYAVDSILMNLAQTHANYIASTGVLTHYDANGSRPYQRAIAAGYSLAGDLTSGGLFAEAIYSGTAPSFDDVISAWGSNSSDENALLSKDYQDIGVGISAANGTTYYVLDVGAQMDNSTATTPVVVTLSPGTSEIVSIASNTPLANGEIYHIVQKNEALWSIAITYGTTIDELKSLNHLASDEIFEGQKLLIRAAATETPTPSPAPVTVTLGIPTSTATQPVPPTSTPTATPAPRAPASLQSGGLVAGVIVLVALLTAGMGAFLARKKKKEETDSPQ